MAFLDNQKRSLIAQLSRAWNVPRHALDVELAVNPRLTRAIARFRRDKHIIELGPGFFRLRSRRAAVLCHELAHAAVDYVHGPKAKPHGPEWRHLVEMIGLERAHGSQHGRVLKPDAMTRVAQSRHSAPQACIPAPLPSLSDDASR